MMKKFRVQQIKEDLCKLACAVAFALAALYLVSLLPFSFTDV